ADELGVQTSRGEQRSIALAPMSVADFYRAVKARAKAPEHIRGRNEDAPASVHVLGIVGSMSFVDIERYLALDFHRPAVDVNRHPDRFQRLHNGTIKICHRHWSERDAALLAATRLHAELVGDEVKIHLEVL